jgi:hypothetical protein
MRCKVLSEYRLRSPSLAADFGRRPAVSLCMHKVDERLPVHGDCALGLGVERNAVTPSHLVRQVRDNDRYRA